MSSKTSEVHTSILVNNPQLIFRHYFKMFCIFTDNFEVFRCDRNMKKTNKKTGGGTLLAIRSDIQVAILDVVTAFRSLVVSRLIVILRVT